MDDHSRFRSAGNDRRCGGSRDTRTLEHPGERLGLFALCTEQFVGNGVIERELLGALAGDEILGALPWDDWNEHLAHSADEHARSNPTGARRNLRWHELVKDPRR